MGKKCPRCKSTNTYAHAPREMYCENCGHEWKPYKHSGKKMKVIGDGVVYPRKRVMPGAKTRTIGDGILFPKRRVKKTRRKERSMWDFP